MKRSLADSLEKALGTDQVCFPPGTAVFKPRDIGSLAEGMRVISAAKGKAAIAGGGAPPSLVSREDVIGISLARMNEVREVNPGDFIIVAGAGAIADDAVRAAREQRMHVPLDITSGARATVGGAYMTDAAGPYAAGYGPFRDYVIGAKCVTAGGDIVTFGGRTMKNVTGYEVTRFLAGTRGIFAIAAELTLKALPLPERQTVLVGQFPEKGDPVSALSGIEATGGVVKTCELLAESGLGGKTLIAIGLEGMEPMVMKGVGTIREFLERAGTVTVREDTPEEFTRFRREAAQRMVQAGFLTL